MPSEPYRPPNPIAHRIRGHNQRDGVPEADSEFTALSRQWGVPEAHIRDTIDFFPELQHPKRRVCTGLPCLLADSSGEIAAEIARNPDGCRGTACAGFCDRAPVTLDALGALEGAAGENQSPEIRSLAANPVFTGRLSAAAPVDLRSAQATGVYGEIDPPETGRIRLDQLQAAGFPEAGNWIQAAETDSDLRFVVAHSHPGNPGAFADRILMESDPHRLIEGLVICGRAIGADEGVIFAAAENRRTFQILEQAAAEVAEAGILEDTFEIAVVSGFGAYVAGEETAMLNAIEGVRGEVRIRPPEPVNAGLFQRPTVVEPAGTFLAAAELIKSRTDRDPGARLISLTAGFRKPGLVEIDGSTLLRDVIGEGGDDESSLAAVLLGGPLGSLLTPGDWDMELNLSELERRGFAPGHWGLTPIPHDANFKAVAVGLLEFAGAESCGKCAPCRLGPLAALDLLEKGHAGGHRFREILELLEQGSLCDFGRKIPGPLRQLVEHFGGRID